MLASGLGYEYPKCARYRVEPLEFSIRKILRGIDRERRIEVECALLIENHAGNAQGRCIQDFEGTRPTPGGPRQAVLVRKMCEFLEYRLIDLVGIDELAGVPPLP